MNLLLPDWLFSFDGQNLTLCPPNRQSLEYLLLEGFPLDFQIYKKICVRLDNRITDITYFAKRNSGLPLTYTPINQEKCNMPLKIAQMEVSPILLKAMMELAEMNNPTGIVDLTSGYQRAVSENSVSTQSGLFFAGISAQDALTIRRAELWLPEDLHKFDAEWPRLLTANDPDSKMEWTWRGKMPGGKQFKQFTTRYKLIQEPSGRLFHACEALGWEDVTPELAS